MSRQPSDPSNFFRWIGNFCLGFGALALVICWMEWNPDGGGYGWKQLGTTFAMGWGLLGTGLLVRGFPTILASVADAWRWLVSQEPGQISVDRRAQNQLTPHPCVRC